jgi:hypothetical protein
MVSRVVENMAASLSRKSVALSISICGRGPLRSAFVDKQGGLDYAFNSSNSSPDRGWCCSLADQPIHTNGGFH